jgi:hypothetical protein
MAEYLFQGFHSGWPISEFKIVENFKIPFFPDIIIHKGIYFPYEI